MLHFNNPNDPLHDEISNTEWIASNLDNNSVIVNSTNAPFNNAMQITDSNPYIRTKNPIKFGGKDYTIEVFGFLSSKQRCWYSSYICTQCTAGSTYNSFCGSACLYGHITLGSRKDGNNVIFNLWNSAGQAICHDIPIYVNVVDKLCHFAIVSYNNVVTVYIDGIAQYSASVVTERLNRYIYLCIHTYDLNNQLFTGSLAEFRLSDGIARYVANFTPPTEPFEVD